MFVIRSEQMTVFLNKSLQQFEDEMIAHCRDFAPELSQIIGEDQIRLAVHTAIPRAEKDYGFTNRGPLRSFIELILLFGCDFDTDPQYPWAANILSGSAEQMQKAQQLYEMTLDYQEKVSGVDAKNTIDALNNLALFLKRTSNDINQYSAAEIPQKLKLIFPQKAEYLGDKVLTELIKKGFSLARRLAFNTKHGYDLMVILMYIFGHGCANDPLYPWIADSIRDEKITDPIARVDRLERNLLTWLDHALLNFSDGAKNDN